MISGYTDGLTLDRSRAHIEFPDGNRATALDLNNTETISQTFRGGDALDVVLRVPRPYGPIPRVRIFVDGLVGPLRRGAQQVPFTSVFGQIEVLATP